MNVLITGGTGLIGTALVAALVSDGHTITVLTRNPEETRGCLPAGVLAHKWDSCSPEGWGHLIEGTDAIINLAGESIAGETLPAIITRRWTQSQKNRIITSRVAVGQVLVEAIRAAAKVPDVFIQASAVGYYGPHGDEGIPENTAAGSDFLAQVCRVWENSTSSLKNIGVRRITIRTGLVLASKGGILPIMLLPFRLFAGGPIGGGTQVIPWIHLKDEINAIRFLLQDRTASGAYNLSAPNPVQQREFAKIAGQILGRPSLIPTPGLALRLVLGEKANLVLEGQRALPQRLLEAGYKFKFEELRPALENLL